MTLQNCTTTSSSFPWDQSLYGDLALLSSQSCDLIDIYPGLPNSLPCSNSSYASSPESDLDQTLALSFLLEDFDNSIGGWDDPTDSALSLLFESPPATPNSGLRGPEMDTAELNAVPSIFPSTPFKSARISNKLDDSVNFEDSITEDSLFQSPQTLQETIDVPPRDGLYSTPLSWERPTLGCRVDNPISFALLSPEEESRLRSIAMPAQSRAISPLLLPSPEPQERQATRNSRKRKSSESSESDSSPPARRRNVAPQKTAHHMIEKRYRTNLNQKIAALRDSVPSLRVIDKDNPYDEHLQGLSRPQKLNKVFIHSYSLSYILPSFPLSSSSLLLHGN